MERKIGEIFEYNGEWYQCVEHKGGHSCVFTLNHGRSCGFNGYPHCDYRSDGKSVIFKKLEKVGEPIEFARGLYFQRYQLADSTAFYEGDTRLFFNAPTKTFVYIEIKTKEDMEEKKLIELLSEKVHNAWMKEKEAQGFSYGKDYDKEKKKHPDMLPYNELKEEVKEYDRATVRAVLQAQKELQSKYNYNNLKSFDLEAAKAGKPVCTRDGRKARIICFDAKGMHQPIIALVTMDNGVEYIETYYSNGRFNDDINSQSGGDLMMIPEKKEGWVNVYKRLGVVTFSHNPYDTKEEALEGLKSASGRAYCIDTIKINWEE